MSRPEAKARVETDLEVGDDVFLKRSRPRKAEAGCAGGGLDIELYVHRGERVHGDDGANVADADVDRLRPIAAAHDALEFELEKL